VGPGYEDRQLLLLVVGLLRPTTGGSGRTTARDSADIIVVILADSGCFLPIR